jgi:DNA-binding transcriptional ArsR family regulator
MNFAARNSPEDFMPAENAEFSLLELDVLSQAAERLRTIAHPHRLRMIQMLLHTRYTVGELADACGIKSHMASEHLRLMQRCGLLTFERDGRKTYYSICEPQLERIMECITPNAGSASPEHNPSGSDA